MNQKIEKTERRITKTAKKLLKFHDMVFFKMSTYATYGYVWVHSSDSIILYEVMYNSTKEKKIANPYGYHLKKKEYNDFSDSRYNPVLDGDLIGYAIKDEEGLDFIGIPCDIDEFMKAEFTPEDEFKYQLQNDLSLILKAVD